jgi:hypothetical protein
MYKKSIFAFLMFICGKAIAQPSQYTPMTAAGYQMKRVKVDSTLHIPSFCGSPSLLNSTSKMGALAMDTCNNQLYKWTNEDGWSAVGGTSIDTSSLSNRINSKIDSINRVGDSVKYYKNGVAFFAYIDSTGGGGSQNLQQVTNVGATSTNIINLQDSIFNSANLYLNKTIPTFSSITYYPFLYLENSTSDSVYIKTLDNGLTDFNIKTKALILLLKKYLLRITQILEISI